MIDEHFMIYKPLSAPMHDGYILEGSLTCGFLRPFLFFFLLFFYSFLSFFFSFFFYSFLVFSILSFTVLLFSSSFPSVLGTLLNSSFSLRSKRFRWAFRRFEAFSAFWTRRNWGERKSVLHSPQCSRRQKAKNTLNVWKTLRKHLLRRLRFILFFFLTREKKSPVTVDKLMVKRFSFIDKWVLDDILQLVQLLV